MNWYQLIQLLKGHKTYLQTHNFPDPDALASAFGMQQFLKKHGIETTICYEGSIDKLSTKRMITEFGMEVFPYSEVENEMQEEELINLSLCSSSAYYKDV